MSYEVYGIFWNDGAEIFAKIKAFLLSNHRYNLLHDMD